MFGPILNIILPTIPCGHPQPGLQTAAHATFGLLHVAGQDLHLWNTWPLMGQGGPHVFWQAVTERNLQW